MKYCKLAIALTTAALVGLLSSPFVSAAGPQNNSKQSLVSIGDSITFGYNLDNNHHPSKDAFPYLFAVDENYRVRNLGIPGDTSSDLLNKLQDQKFQEAVRHADVITLDIGSNDFLKGAQPLIAQMMSNPAYSPSPSDIQLIQEISTNFASNLDQIVTQIRSLTDAPIVLYNIYNPFFGLDRTAGLLLAGANQAIDSYGNDPSIKIANAFGAFAGKQDILIIPGDVHPNEQGQEVLAQLAVNALNQ